MPSLTARSFAEMMTLPAYAQVRLLSAQKNPKQEPNVFKLPFYQTALTGIKNYYRQGNEPNAISVASIKAQSLNPRHKAQNNIRVLRSFQRGAQYRRVLDIERNEKYVATPYLNVQLRLIFDITAEENGKSKYILYNCRNVAIDGVIASNILQVAYWVASQSATGLRIKQLELIDLYDGRVYSERRPSTRVVNLMMQNAQIVNTLWDTV